MSQFYYKVTSKTKNPLDGFVTKKIKAIRRPAPAGYFATENEAHHSWLVNVWRPCFNPSTVKKELYRITFSGGGYFFKDQMRDFDKFKANMESVGFSVDLDKERADEGMYRINGDPMIPLTLEDAFKLLDMFGEVYLEEHDGQKEINIGRI